MGRKQFDDLQRRQSGLATLGPLALSPLGWWNADQLVAETGGNVDSWGDITGTQPDWTAAGVVRPELVTLGTGRRAVRFDPASSDNMQLGTFVGAGNDWTLAVAIDSDGDIGTVQQLIRARQGAIPDDAFVMGGPSTVGIIENGSATFRDSGVALTAGPQVVIWRLQSGPGIQEVFKSSPTVPDGSTAYGGVWTMTGTITLLGQSGSGQQYLSGALRDFSIYNRALSDSEVAFLYAYSTAQLAAL